jgi:putative hemolysin
MHNLYLDILIVLIIILANSFFVVAEIAIIASRQPKLDKMARQGKFGASKALRLARDPESFLSTVQVGITLMNILIGLYGGAAASDYIEDYVKMVPLFEAYSSTISYVIAVAVITYFTVLGEIIPKRLAMLYPEKIAIQVAHGMYCAMYLFFPFVFILGRSMKLFMRAFNIQKTKHVSTEEVRFIINQAESEGLIKKTERDILARIIGLSDIQVGSIMTPRKKIIALNLKDSPQKNIAKLCNYPFSYFPVIDESIDNILGVVSVKRLFNQNITTGKFDIHSKMQSVVYIPDIAKVSKLLEQFRKKKARIAIVLDEYGEIEGLVTLKDVFRVFMGDVFAASEGLAPRVQINSDNSYLVTGDLPIKEVQDLLNMNEFSQENRRGYRTLASFILTKLNSMPKTGDQFEEEGWNFKIVKMDGFRIERVMIRKVEPQGK